MIFGRPQAQLGEFLRDLLAAAAEAGDVQAGAAPDELATFCVNALAAAGSLRSEAAVRRLVTVVLAGLRHRA